MDAALLSLDELTDVLGDRVVTSRERVAAYTTDASRAVPDGLPCAVVMATCTEDVSHALSWASRHHIPVSVRGSGTGLTGGAVGSTGGSSSPWQQ